MKTMLYIAYGSNLHKGQMQRRCPNAVAIGSTTIPNTRLVFRGVADIEDFEGASCPVGVWHITEQCERALDIYEGVKNSLYRKEYLPLKVRRNGEETIEQGLVYVMNANYYGAPSDFYYDTIRLGYNDFGLDERDLKAALRTTKAIMKSERETFKAARRGDIEIM